MTKTTKAARIAALVAVVLGAGTAAQAAEAYANWDNFNGKTLINPTLWLSAERVRSISGGTLNMMQREYGMQTDNVGYFSESWSTNIERNASAITQMRVLANVKSYRTNGCVANPNPTIAQARLAGFFFNVGAGAPSSRIDDIFAGIALVRRSNSTDTSNVLRVEAQVSRCTTADCNSGSETLFTQDLGTATLGNPVLLTLEWDRAGNRFAFIRDSGNRVVYNYGARFSNDSTPPSTPSRFVGTRLNLANCFGGSRTDGMMNVSFDDLAVNTSAK